MTQEYLLFIKAILQIGILAFLFYMVLKALRRTRGLAILGSVFAFLAIMQVLTMVSDGSFTVAAGADDLHPAPVRIGDVSE